MIPATNKFIGKPDYMIMKRVDVNATSAINVASFLKVGPKEIRVTLASAPTNFPNKVTIALADNAGNNGTFKILKSDLTNDYLFIENVNGLTETPSGTPTATPTGIAMDFIDTNDGVRVENNERQLVAMQYDEDGYFIYYKDRADVSISFQVTNLDSATAMTTATVEMSLDGVEWHPCPTALASGAIAATESAILIFDWNIVCYLRVNVDSNSADYCIIAR